MAGTALEAAYDDARDTYGEAWRSPVAD